MRDMKSEVSWSARSNVRREKRGGKKESKVVRRGGQENCSQRTAHYFCLVRKCCYSTPARLGWGGSWEGRARGKTHIPKPGAKSAPRERDEALTLRKLILTPNMGQRESKRKKGRLFMEPEEEEKGKAAKGDVSSHPQGAEHNRGQRGGRGRGGGRTGKTSEKEMKALFLPTSLGLSPKYRKELVQEEVYEG